MNACGRMQWTSAVFLLLGLLPVSSIHGQGIAINDTGAPPNPHALLDVDGSTHDRGVLLPRMTTAERTAIAGLGAAEEGLTVYDTTSKSYWFWDGAQWVQLGGGGAGWGLTGNAGTVMGTNYLGNDRCDSARDQDGWSAQGTDHHTRTDRDAEHR
ncbi:MAG: hypothetical protein IPG35_00010 [Flavobacteriales bacterium]|nr:hypothetical protein [Flavobacteriales bacterium]